MITPNVLVWLDMEMTGLDPQEHVIIEIAVVITDHQLQPVFSVPSMVIYQPEHELTKMDNWNASTHNKSGLLAKIPNGINISIAQDTLLSIIKQYVPAGLAPLCGNTVHHDRKFLAKYMPLLEQYFHYRNIDVSTIKELSKLWYPNLKFSKHNKHQALEDILESINELRFYREHIFI